LVGRDAFFVLDFGLDIVDCIGGFDLEGYSFAREGFDEAVLLLEAVGYKEGFGGRRGEGYICTVGC
jgi:hypothetical protein